VTVKERVACARPSFDLPTVGWKVIIMRNSYSAVSTVHWVASVFCRSVLPPPPLSFRVVLKDCPVIIGLSDAKRDSYNLFGLETSLRELRDAPGNRRDLDVKWRARKSGRDGELFCFHSIIVHDLTSIRVRNTVVIKLVSKLVKVSAKPLSINIFDSSAEKVSTKTCLAMKPWISLRDHLRLADRY
jgi:hypothetical protein